MVRHAAAVLVIASVSSGAAWTADEATLLERAAEQAAPRSATLQMDVQTQPLEAAQLRPAAASAQAWMLGASPQANAAGQSLRTRLWLQRGALGLGWGTDAPMVGEGARGVVSMRADLMPNTRLWVEQAGRPMNAASPLSALPGWQDGAVTRIGLEFKSPKRSDGTPLSIFRFQVSGGSTVTVRPRGGGMSFSYRSVF